LSRTSHRCYHAAHGSEEQAEEEGPTVGLYDCFTDEKLDEHGLTLVDMFPDTGHPDVLPAGIFEAIGDENSFDQITENMKKLGPAPFSKTDGETWRKHLGPAFEKIMSGDYGEGVQYLDVEKDDEINQDPEKPYSPIELFQEIDVDSGMGWLSHLGIIQTDVTIYLYPLSSRNFGASLHLYLQTTKDKVSIDKIPHFLLGEFGANAQRSIQLYLFLPNLYTAGRKTNGVSDQLKDAFISRVFIPAADIILPDFTLEQFGGNMREIKTDCEAPMYEGQLYGPAGHRLPGGVCIPLRYLEDLWTQCTKCLRREINSGDELLVPFEDCRLFWSFKGWKYALSATSHREIRGLVKDKVHPLPVVKADSKIESCFDMDRIDNRDFHLDFGILYGIKTDRRDRDNPIGFTTLPRQCCIKQLVKTLQPDPEWKCAKLKPTYFNWCLTNDIAAMSVETPAGHPYRRHGFSFLQVYPGHKNLFDAQSHYPFPAKDDSGVCIALDDHTLSALYSTVQRPTPERGACYQSWRHSASRLFSSLMSDKHSRSFFTRGEVRLDRNLSEAVFNELDARHDRASVEPEERLGLCPFIAHRTQTVNSWVLVVTQAPARLFQEIISQAEVGHLGVDRQKLAVLMFQLQKVTYSASNLSTYKYLWRGQIRREDSEEEEEEREQIERGLGIGEMIKKYGFGYPQHGLIDWTALMFTSSHIADQFPHPARALKNLKARGLERAKVKDLLQDIDYIIPRIRKEQDPAVRELQLDWLAMQLARQFHLDVCNELVWGPMQFASKEHHKRRAIERADGDGDGDEQDMEEQVIVEDHEDVLSTLLRLANFCSRDRMTPSSLRQPMSGRGRFARVAQDGDDELLGDGLNEFR